MVKDLLLVLFGGGFCVGLLKFIEFLIKRRDEKQLHQEERADKKDDTYAALRKEFKEGLDEREATGKWRFEENSAKIDKLFDVSNDLKDNVLLLTTNISQMQEYNVNVGDAMKGIIHDRIVHNVDGFIERNGITNEEISTLKSMYYPYKKLGGNGDVETAFETATKLPPITKEEAIKRDAEIKRSKLNGKE